MLRLAIQRLVLAMPLLLVVTFAVFALVSLMPGDPARILAGSNPELVPLIRRTLNLNKPLPVRYFRWLGHAVRGDLGESYVQRQSVRLMISAALPITLSLTVISMIMSAVIASVAGVAAALRAGKITDRVTSVGAALAIASPPFWIGYLLVLIFAIDNHWLPAIGYVPISTGLWPWFSHLLLPALTLSFWSASVLALQLRGSLIDVLQEDYILSARAKGLSSVSVVGKHAFKNAAAAVVTVLGFQLAQLLGGVVLIENVFSLPGLGSLALTATVGRDVPVMLGLVVVTTLFVVVVNFFVDVSYGYFNPKIRS